MGKSLAGSTEWKIDVIFPVAWEMTIVASVNRPATTALEEARTVMGVAGMLCGAGGGVVACGAMMGKLVEASIDKERKKNGSVLLNDSDYRMRRTICIRAGRARSAVGGPVWGKIGKIRRECCAVCNALKEEATKGTLRFTVCVLAI